MQSAHYNIINILHWNKIKTYANLKNDKSN